MAASRLAVALVLLALPLLARAQDAPDPFEWKATGLMVQGADHYWSEKMSRRTGVVGLHEVVLVEMFKTRKPAPMGKETVYAITEMRVYDCATGAYETKMIYLVLEPDITRPTAKSAKYDFDAKGPDGGGTVKAGTPHRQFIDRWCSGG